MAQMIAKSGSDTAFVRRSTLLFHQLSQTLRNKSKKLIGRLSLQIERIFDCWIIAILLLSIGKLLTAPAAPAGSMDMLDMLLPYLLIACAPIAGYRIAERCFAPGSLHAQPQLRLTRSGRWQKLSVLDARNNPLFGPVGFMASLVIGLLMNVPLRTMEYLTAVPAVSGDAPQWAQAIFHLMTLDLVVMSFFYMVCFVMALRSVPLFTRMLLFTWLMDITMQLVIAQHVSTTPGLPASVAGPMGILLSANIKKVCISIMIWLPYLLLSERVNITFRQRKSAS